MGVSTELVSVDTHYIVWWQGRERRGRKEHTQMDAGMIWYILRLKGALKGKVHEK